jgi:hypothetical protein
MLMSSACGMLFMVMSRGMLAWLMQIDLSNKSSRDFWLKVETGL